MDVCDSALSDEALVGCFEYCFAEGGIGYDGEASDEHEGSDSGGFIR